MTKRIIYYLLGGNNDFSENLSFANEVKDFLLKQLIQDICQKVFIF